MPTFKQLYEQLNSAQRTAVDTIEGPVMVIAGPGTGKTQLLSMRVANILRQTDVLPNNILCLTFTDSAVTAMRERLVSVIGPDGYKVAMHTFHSFGTEVINRYPEYFYNGANFRPADELSSFEVLEKIFAALPHSNALAGTMNGQFTSLHDAQRAIGELKKAGLTPDELLKLLDHNDLFIAYAEPILAHVFTVPRLSKKDISRCGDALDELGKFQTTTAPFELIRPLSDVCIHEFTTAVEAAQASESTKPLSAWRARWLEKNSKKAYVLKDHMRSQKLRALADVYYKYLLAMQEQSLFDFDDMILRVLHALEYFNELRYNLQEQYQYILVDEFQDTNGAQLRLLQNLLDSDSNNDRPNIMIVGDDDQAIYAFQGAELSNILQFRDLYKNPAVITLTDNYRSTKTILTDARNVITQGEYRLETAIESIDKTLTAHQHHASTKSELHQFTNPTQQYVWMCHEIKELVDQGTQPKAIAVLARNHRQLLELLPFLRQAHINIAYERRNNVLEAEHIQALILLARTIAALAEEEFDKADALLPQLLSYDFWRLKTNDVWHLSLTAYKERRFWLELMLDRTDMFRAIAEFLIIASHKAQHEPLDTMLDFLIGSNEKQASSDVYDENDAHPTGPTEEFISPLRGYYFNASQLDTNPGEYLTRLSNLATIRHKLRDYRPDKILTLGDFVSFIDLHEKTKTTIVDTAEYHDNSQSVNLLTAHKAKGLEFDAVFVVSCQEDIWGMGARSHASSISFPRNLPIEPAGQTNDDCLRLFFVAMTRARQHLYLCSYAADTTGKPSMLASFLTERMRTPVIHPDTQPAMLLAETLEPSWQSRQLSLSAGDRLTMLQPRLETYQLSATHLNNFIDVANGGPQAFLLQNLLRFPQAMTRSAIFGSAVHTVLQRAHIHLTVTGERRPTEDVLHDFELQLQAARLNDQDFAHLLEKGSAVLENFLAKRHSSFQPNQKVEYIVSGVIVDQARLTGAIDLMELNNKEHTIAVTDYKTGKPASGWQGISDFEKIKLHKYRQQLMMYKLLLEHSREFGNSFTVQQATLEFVEPDGDKEIQRLTMAFRDEDLDRFKKLVQIVWQHIMKLDMPDTSSYPASYKGLLQFEEDLLNGIV